jgi:hypothetical protein
MYSRKKNYYATSVARIEGINPFSGVVAGKATLATLVRLVEILLVSFISILVYLLLLVYF